ncbi:MAG: lyase family protein [Planctomycetota bacterium]
MRALAAAAGALLLSAVPSAQAGGTEDAFARLMRINRASLVALAEGELVPRALASRIAEGIERIEAEQAAPDAPRSGDYLEFEARLLELAGPAASRLHTGRSRQDIGSTSRRLALRAGLLEAYDAQLGARAALLALAADHTATLVPGYTHGVQAQPTTLGHVLMAFASAFERDAARLEQAYARVDRSPLGAAVLSTSGFPLDRRRLAELVGFGGVIENAFDANLVASVDSKIEVASVLATSAVHVGQLVENLHTQYHAPAPWVLLSDAKTSGSSIMPQKRNPRPLDALRRYATSVVGGAHTVTLFAHNTSSGMHDYRDATQVLSVCSDARAMYALYAEVVASLHVDAERARREVEADYATMTEVADVLLRDADVPFRIGHGYASRLTDLGRRTGRRPKDLTAAELTQTYREVTGAELPLDVERLQRALDPRAMVLGRRGLGGTQPEETARMLASHGERLAAARTWLATARERIATADAQLREAFAALR